MKLLIRYIKSLIDKNSLHYYLLLIVISFVLGLLNNVIVDDEQSVSWFGGQEILEKPDDL